MPGGSGLQPIPTPEEEEEEPAPAEEPEEEPEPGAHLTACPTCGDMELTVIIDQLGECVTCATRPTPNPAPRSQDELDEEYRRSKCSCGREKSPDDVRCPECDLAISENTPPPDPAPTPVEEEPAEEPEEEPAPVEEPEPRTLDDLPPEEQAEYLAWEEERARQERADLQTEQAEHTRRRRRAESQERILAREAAKPARRHPVTSPPAEPEPKAPTARPTRSMPTSKARRPVGAVKRGTTTKVYGIDESPPASSDPRPFSIFK